MLLRPGSAGPDTVTDHVEVLGAAIAQVPARFRGRIMVRVDGAGASHELIDHLLKLASPRRKVLFTCGWMITPADEDAIRLLPGSAWKPGVDQDGNPEEDKHVAEITHLMSRAGKWPEGLRWIVRRTKPSRRHAGNLTAYEKATGWRYSIICTSIPATGIPGVPGSHHSRENRRHLMRAGGAYILGEKLRSAAPDIQAALSRQGRYRQVAGNMHVKEVRVDDAGDRMVICYNPEAATRDAAIRGQLITQLTGMIEGTDTLSATDRARLSGVISAKDGLKKFLKTTTSGLLRIDTARIRAEQRLDGKFLLRCGDARISAEDIALGYKQLLEVERGWRDMKQIIDLRPVCHHLEDRIRAHVTLCWLALLLIRITETATGQTWNHLRAELQRIHLGTFAGDHGTFTHRTQLTASHKHILKALDLAEPPLVISAAPATP
jgi:hypothetical protein